ncbi:MAG: hypothetical protein SGILL_004851 [Bacillariaceae sp.]
MNRVQGGEGESRKEVKFNTLEIREYPLMMGDSPASARGIPLTIGWDHIEEHSGIPIDEYEHLRPMRRERDELKMESLDRVRMLKSEGVGYSRREIQEGVRQVDMERRKREQTRNWMRFSPLEEAVENVQRFVLHSVVFRSSHQKQRSQLVVPYQDKGRNGYLRKRQRWLLTRKNTSLNESVKKEDSLFFDESKSTQYTVASSTSMGADDVSFRRMSTHKRRSQARTMIQAMEEDAASSTERTVGDLMSTCSTSSTLRA